jgi:DNA-binding transcriptional regulator YiaG
MTTRADTPPRNASQVIRSWRRRVGLTQEGLAQALSVTFSTVSRWENGHVLPSKLAWRALQQLAVERNCPLADESSRPN